MLDGNGLITKDQVPPGAIGGGLSAVKSEPAEEKKETKRKAAKTTCEFIVLMPAGKFEEFADEIDAIHRHRKTTGSRIGKFIECEADVKLKEK